MENGDHILNFSQKIWYPYLLDCQDGSIYTGIALNVHERFKLHQLGKGARYTRSHPPACLLAVAEFSDRASAQCAEYQLKRCSAQQKREITAQLSQGKGVYL